MLNTMNQIIEQRTRITSVEECSPDQIQSLIDAVDRGEMGAAESMLPMVYDQLRSIAEALMRRERPGQTLQATALVHEAYVKLAGSETNWETQRHFFNTAAKAMKHLLIDRARRRDAEIHGGKVKRQQIDMVDIPANEEYTLPEVEGLGQALSELSEHNNRWGEIVHLRFFLGLTIKQTAEMLEISQATVKNDWQFARAWLKVRMKSSLFEDQSVE